MAVEIETTVSGYVEYAGAILDDLLRSDGIQRPSDEELRSIMLVGEQFASAEDVLRASANIAAQVIRQEERLVDHQREDYAPPVIVVLLNGGVPAATRVLELVAGYGHHYDPIFINPSGYGASQVVGDIEIAKGLTAAERVRISGRRVIVFDDVHDTGKTSYETTKYLHDSTQGIVEYLGADYELFPPESIQYAFLFDKQPDPSALVGLEEYSGEPDFIGAEAPRSWITGFGCDTNIPDCYVGEPPQLVCGESVGRYALGGWIALQQPE